MKQPSTEISHQSPDVIITGGGIVGLSIALELDARGARVTVLERDTLLQQASSAAAGMLAVHDPHNPTALKALAKYSTGLYPRYLEYLNELSGMSVPLQTGTTIQYDAEGLTQKFTEFSLDPRQLSETLRRAVANTRISLRESLEVADVITSSSGVQATTHNGERLHAAALVLATGAWNNLPSLAHLPLFPRKGQMLRVKLPPSLAGLNEVHRGAEIYIVPRTSGPRAGSALLGATVEDAGFDLTTHESDLAALRALAATLLPQLGDASTAPTLETWAGLRPATPDALPILSELETPNVYAALGHYRNGILLAPATAQVMADMVERKLILADLMPFAASRFKPEIL